MLHQLLHALVKARLVEKQHIMGEIRHFSRMPASGAVAAVTLPQMARLALTLPEGRARDHDPYQGEN